LQEALGRTRLDDVSGEDVTAPSPYLYVALPGCGLRLWGGKLAKWHSVGGALIYLNDSMSPLLLDRRSGEFSQAEGPSPGHVTFYIWGMDNEGSQGAGNDASFYLTLDFGVVQKHNLDLEKCLYAAITESEEANGAFPEDPIIRAEMVRNVRQAVRILLNTLLYIGSQDAELETDPQTLAANEERAEHEKTLARVKSPKKRKRIERKRDALPEERVVWVGRSVEVPEEGSEKAPWTRGHWWPRKSSLRQRLQRAGTAVAEGEKHLAYLRQCLKDDPTPLERAKTLQEILAQEDLLEEGRETCESLEADLCRQHQWVRPHLRSAQDEKSESESPRGGRGKPGRVTLHMPPNLETP